MGWGTREGRFLSSLSSLSSAGLGPEGTGVGSRRGEKFWREMRDLT